MNLPQRIILAIGALCLLGVLVLTPSTQNLHGVIYPAYHHHNLANLWDWRSALVHSAIISVATAAVYFAASSRKP